MAEMFTDSPVLDDVEVLQDNLNHMGRWVSADLITERWIAFSLKTYRRNWIRVHAARERDVRSFLDSFLQIDLVRPEAEE